MKKFLIYLASFLILFGASVAFAGVYIENFEDGVLDPGWFATDFYDITTFDGSKGLHMYRACDDCNGYTQVGTNTNELIYHFAVDIYLASEIYGIPGADIDLMQWKEGGESFKLWAGFYLNPLTGNIQAFVNLYDSNDQETHIEEFLEAYKVDDWNLLSITISEGSVTFGIDGNETNIVNESIQKPDSGFCGARVQVVSNDSENGYVDYWVDNLAVYTATGETIHEVVDSVEEWIEDEKLVGVGEGASADGRLNAFVNMLQNARDLFNADDIAGACAQLEDAYGKCDGEQPPPDFVEADEEVLEDLQDMITTLMTDFGC